MKIERNADINTTELNELLQTIGWAINPVEKLDKTLALSWGWITARGEDGKLVGFVQVLSDGIKHAYILRLLVHKDYQRQRVGTKIMEELLAFLKENKLNPILITKSGEEDFYNKFGLSRENNGFISLFKWE
ncbi:MAG: family N-acetyltransferase [Anaerosolibacter sp.]|jgi:ribosomal protein S18 acetylase RimI-like enzyme|uniref:GNAT family N-acetyltransferase n=1 Tax=Anaerosolibacter sp. TaxID=1872527 RepID=UPI002601B507|nr:GNAT family N-acetyltransferase [Anaerosolibacter sp.]MDF2546932.1 family N-acetyltransferase [Anaerosolibacter sp.]